MPEKSYEQVLLRDVSPDEFVAWEEWPYIYVEGNCPRCNHETTYPKPIGAVRTLKTLTEEQTQRANRVLQEGSIEADITVFCWCTVRHPDRPESEDHGCGAYWGFYAQSGNMRGGVREVVLARPRTQPDPENEEALRELTDTQLDQARTSAGNWRTALGGLLAAVLAVGVFERDSIADFDQVFKILISACLVLALILSVYGLYRVTRAAFGQPNIHDLTKMKVTTWKYEESVKVAQDIWWAQRMTVLSVGLLATAILMTWFAPEAAAVAYLEAKRDDTEVCGELETDGDELWLAVAASEGKTETIPLDELNSIEIVSGC